MHFIIIVKKNSSEGYSEEGHLVGLGWLGWLVRSHILFLVGEFRLFYRALAVFTIAVTVPACSSLDRERDRTLRAYNCEYIELVIDEETGSHIIDGSIL